MGTALSLSIHERRQTERSLKDAGEFAKQIIDSASCGIIVLGPAFRFVAWNPFMEASSGVSEEEILGRKACEVFPLGDHQQHGALGRRNLESAQEW